MSQEIAMLRDQLIGKQGNSLANVDPLKSAQDIYLIRRKRSQIFHVDLFGEPAWDILLDLYISEKTGKLVAITDACLAACVPLTTALRHVSLLCDAGIAFKVSDSRDKRRHFLRLTPRTSLELDQFFTSILRT